MRFSYFLLFAGMSVLPAIAGHTQRDPFLGSNQYPQYRNVSGLGGGGYGLDSKGYGSLEGPTAFSTPLAYTLGHDQFRFAVQEMSFDSGFRAGFGQVNGSGLVAYGHTFGNVNVAFSDLFLSRHLDQGLNLQVQFIPTNRSRWSSSVGVQDVVGHGGNSGENVPGNTTSTRSAFAAFTYRADTRRRPVFLTVGMGTERFRQGFSSVSYQLYGPIRTWIEYDGYGFNEGLLFSVRGGRGLRAELNTTIAWIRGRYPTIGTTFGF